MHWQSPPPPTTAVSDNGSGSTTTVKRGPTPEVQDSLHLLPLPLRQEHEQDVAIHNTQAGLDLPLRAAPTPAQIKRRRQGRSRKGRSRQKFPDEKKEETAETRKRGVCGNCRRTKTRVRWNQLRFRALTSCSVLSLLILACLL